MVNKDQKGNPASPEDFPILVNVAVNKFFDEVYKELLALSNEKGTPLSELLVTNTRMKRYLAKEQLPYNYGYYPLPTTFKHELSATCQMGSRPITKRRKVDLVSHTQFDREITNDLRDDLDEVVKGLVRMDLTSIELTSTWDYVMLSFVRKLVNCIFDYCYDAFGNVYYMPPTYQIKLASGHYNLYNGNAVVIYDVIHPTATSFPHLSTSVEIDVDEEFHDEIAKIVIIDMSIKDRELNVVQAEASKQ